MRKAVWGAGTLGVWVLSGASPIREVAVLHQVLSLALVVGYLLLSFDPPEASKRQRDLFLAGFVCAIAAFLLAFLDLPYVANVLARALAVAVVALPVWLVAGPFRSGFIAAGVLAVATIVPALEETGGYATSLHAYAAAASVFAVAALLHKPTLLVRDKKPPRIVVASNIVTLTSEEKARALARLEKRYRDGEFPEHVYLDKRQEIESR